MGIKEFSKVFSPSREIKYKDLKGETILIDASLELHRALKGMASIYGLTDGEGNPTQHINVCLLNINKFYQNGIKQIWVFDHFDEKSDAHHNPQKEYELAKRRLGRENATKEIAKLKDIAARITINDSGDELDVNELDVNELATNELNDETKETKGQTALKECHDAIAKQEKRAFEMKPEYFWDLQFILDSLDILWCISPAGVEAEQLAAWMSEGKIVYSSDMDALVFGATKLVTRDIKTKKLYLYELPTVLTTIGPDAAIDDLIKIAVALGCDFASKSKGIGIKTILKKWRGITFDAEQQKAIAEFKKPRNLSGVVWHNEGATPFADAAKKEALLEWLANKGFNRKRIETQLNKTPK